MKRNLLMTCSLSITLLIVSKTNAQQCLGGGCSTFTNQYPSTIYTPTTSWNTHGFMNAGNWTLFNVTSGNTYQWTYCESYGGVSTNWDAQLTLYNNNNINNPICFSTDVCGTNGNAPYISWTATFTGTARILTTVYTTSGCHSNTGSPYNTLAWRYIGNTTQYGSVHVTISPSNAINAGALWNLDGGTWQNSGNTVSNIPIGNHTINYNTISGWTSPSTQSVNVTNNSTSNATGTYTQNAQYGSVHVTISPSNAVNAGAKWNLDGGTWQNSGTTLSNIPTGNHTINYNTISGWTSPSTQPVNVTNNSTSSATGNYTQNTQYGSVNVTISPSNAVNAGAKWNLDGGTWQNSGTTLSNIPTGNHAINYNTISGWISSSNQSINVINNSTSNSTGTYTQSGSSLPDLMIQNPQISSSGAVANSSVLLTFIVKNIGNSNANASITSVHLSTDNIFQSGIDLFLKDTATFPLAAGGVQTITMPVRIPSNTSNGNWYLLISANGTAAFQEANSSNNMSFVVVNISSCFASVDKYKNIYNGSDNSQCLNGQNTQSYADVWNFFRYQCVSYVAFKVNESWGYIYPQKKFTNQYTTPSLSNAKNWASRLQAKGYIVNNIPSVGSIAWYDGHTGSTSPNGAGPEGHVAFIDCIAGSVITLSEYNWDKCKYGIRNIDLFSPSAPQNRHPDLYIHTEVGGLGSASNDTTLTNIPFDFIVYPNPTSGNVTLKFNDSITESANLNVFNMMGQLILTQKVGANIGQVYLNLTDKPNGMYFIRITSSAFNVARKIIISH